MEEAAGAPDGRVRTGTWRFGRVVLDEATAQLHVAGDPVQLDRSSYDVLLALLRHAGEIVTKDELLDAGWPGRVVSENSLAKAVSRLRQALAGDGEAIRVVHGYGYRLAATVRLQPSSAPLVAPPDEAMRLREGDPVPHRSGWRIERRLGMGSSGVTFLARSPSGDAHAFKFAKGEAGVHGIKREITLTRYIRAVKADLPDVALVVDWNLRQPPFFVELPYFPHGNLADWAAAHGGLAQLDMAMRLELSASLCETVAGLHEIGVIHKDLKPENLYPCPDADGRHRMVLSDLGAGEAALSPRLAELGLTLTLLGSGEARAGSLMYLAPEVIAGEEPTVRSDVFALGVLLYQMVVGNLRRPLAPGWESDVENPLLHEDIALAAASNPERRQLDARALAERLRTLESRCEQREREGHARVMAQRREQALQRERSRRRLWLTAAIASGIGLVGALAMYFRAENALREAETQARQHQAVLAFVNHDILGQGDAYGGEDAAPDITLLAAVQRAASHVDQRLGDDPASPRVVHAMVGPVLFARDRHAAAIDELERARALYRGAGNDEEALVRVETALCDVHRIASDFARAEEACMAAWNRARRTGSDVALASLKLGQLRTEQGHYADAHALLQPLLAQSAFAGNSKYLGELRWALGLGARNSGRFEEARQHFEALLALYRKAGPQSTWMGWAYNSLGSVMVETGDYARAETTLLAARDAFVHTQGEGGVEAQMPNIWRAEIRLRQGHWHEARAMQQALLDAWRDTLRPNHPLRLLAEANLAWAEAGDGMRDQAHTRLDAALRNRAVVFDRPGDRIAERTLRWIRVAITLGDRDAANELFGVLDKGLAREDPGPIPMRVKARCLRAQWSLLQGDHSARINEACEAATAPATTMDATGG